MQNIEFRRALLEDVPTIIHLLAEDPLGSEREDVSSPHPRCYKDAFNSINSDPNQLLIVLVENEKIIGTFQLSFIPGLSRKGSWRAQVEAVRIAQSHRGKGIGRFAFEWIIKFSRDKRCNLLQLTTDKSRADAHRFYNDLGFVPSHIGYKKIL
ncbi:GNAT family N-acetyltransferase [Brucellaceae bacterium C25G]